jgi:hypothetical protein
VGAGASLGIGVAFGATGSSGHELLRAGAHAATQGGISAAQGGNFWQGALSGGIGSGISSGIDALGGAAGHQILAGGLGGGIGSSLSGGNFWQGFGQGIAVGAFNHALHSIKLGDPVKGDMCVSGNEVLIFNGETWEVWKPIITGTGQIIATDSPIEWVLGAWKTPFQAVDNIGLLGFAKFAGGNIAPIISGFSKHGLNQAISRGFKTAEILKIVRNGNSVSAMGRYGSQVRYTLGQNTEVLNAKNQVVTVFSTAKNGMLVQ